MKSKRIALLALVPAAALVVAGCGGDGIDNSKPAESRVTVAQAAAGGSQAMTTRTAEVEVPTMGVDPSGTAPELLEGTIAPDIVIEVPSTSVAPGDVVEFTVFGTPDVNELVLWDGLNDRQAFSYDGSTGTWRVQYRVPLRPASERLGISVTARNGDDRWRRRWVFREVGTPAPEAEPVMEDARGI